MNAGPSTPVPATDPPRRGDASIARPEPRCAVAHVMLDVGVRSETFVTNAIEAVGREGWRPHVVGLTARGEFGALPADRIHCTGTGTLVGRAIGRLMRRTPEQRFADQAASCARAWRIGLLHAHFGWSGNYAAPLASLLDVPLVVTFYGSDATEPTQDAASGFPCGYSRTVQADTAGDRGVRIRRATSTCARIRRSSRADPQRTAARSPRAAIDGAGDGGRTPSAVRGRLVPFKGADVLFRAMPTILAAHPTARLDLIGDGPDRAAFRRSPRPAARRCGLVPRLARPCRRGRGDAAAHVLVVPGRTMPSGSGRDVIDGVQGGARAGRASRGHRQRRPAGDLPTRVSRPARTGGRPTGPSARDPEVLDDPAAWDISRRGGETLGRGAIRPGADRRASLAVLRAISRCASITPPRPEASSPRARRHPPDRTLEQQSQVSPGIGEPAAQERQYAAPPPPRRARSGHSRHAAGRRERQASSPPTAASGTKLVSPGATSDQRSDIGMPTSRRSAGSTARCRRPADGGDSDAQRGQAEAREHDRRRRRTRAC